MPILLLALLASPALAQGPLSFSAQRSAVVGEAAPVVRFTPRVAGQLEAEMVCGEQRWEVDVQTTPGEVVAQPLEGLAEGVHACTTQLTLRVPGMQPASMSVDFEVARLSHLQWDPVDEAIDLEAGTLKLGASRPLQSATLLVLREGGAEEARRDADLSDPAAPRFAWEPAGGVVLQLQVVAKDAWGFRSQLTLSPWSLEIPHEDVVFATGSSAITEAEAPKLERAWAPVAEAVQRYGSVVELSLYVAGYTDTVGEASSNQALSESRARAIARWFQARGFPGPVYYQGFGEEVLAVPTPDQTDEAANRRAVYVISIDPPATSQELPRARWRPLP